MSVRIRTEIEAFDSARGEGATLRRVDCRVRERASSARLEIVPQTDRAPRSAPCSRR